MPASNKTIYSLLEIARSIQQTVSDRFKELYWIRAEINKLNYYHRSGHCYPELVEKKDGKVVAQIRANLWKDDYTRVDEKFRLMLKEPLKDGIKVLLLAGITYHPEYGLALRIVDIDPSYTLGDLEREKQETIDKLRSEGIFDKNKELELPLLPQRLAIISVETSKGYADFMSITESANKKNGWVLFHMLFPSLLQGDQAIDAILQQLERIRLVARHFDAVAIIRGGGGDIGLSCYNNYKLARAIALFPLPVITGIGHATNETVTEMVAHENAITPTKLAEMILQRFQAFANSVEDAATTISNLSTRILKEAGKELHAEIRQLPRVTKSIIKQERQILLNSSRDLHSNSTILLRKENTFLKNAVAEMGRVPARLRSREMQLLDRTVTELNRSARLTLERSVKTLHNTEQRVRDLSPDNVLRRGYSITLLNGKSIKSISEVQPGNELKTVISDGVISSTVQETENNKGNEK